MFRAAQSNAFDDAVVKATDETLTSENWEFILDVCDKVGAEDSGAKDAVASMIKRLAHRNANVQLYTLELANALSQNCGLKIHKELASRSFTDALLRLANERNTHQQVKAKIIERMGEWAEMFSRDPDLGIMEQAYMKLKSQNPSLQPPSKPFKQEITDVDRRKEEDELQMALALSIKDKTLQKPNQTSRDDSVHPGSTGQVQPISQSLPSGTTAATVSRVRALFDFQPSEAGELQFRKGDIIAVLESVYKDWWKGSLRGLTGIFPLNYVEKLQDPTQEEVQREAQMEAEVFAEIKNVEKLLTLLSASGADLNARDNEEITTLYHQTLSIRPKLIELIGKYSQKKDDFTQLNEKFIKARRDYESLLEASMSQSSQPQYAGRPPQTLYGYGGGPPPPQVFNAQPPPSQPTPDPQNYYGNRPSAASPDPHYPPQTGPAPFYMIPLQQQQQQQQQQNQDSMHPMPLNPDRNRLQKVMSPGPYPSVQQQQQQQPQQQQQQPLQQLQRPTSQYNNPQELATTSYDSPTSNYDSPLAGRPQSLQIQQGPPAVQEGYGYQQQQQQQAPDTQYNQSDHHPQQYSGQPPQPLHNPPAVPGSISDNGHLYAPQSSQDLNVQQGQYQNYQTSAGRYSMGSGGMRAGGHEADASDFYR